MRVINSILPHSIIIVFFSFLQIFYQSLNAHTITADSVRLKQYVMVLTKAIKPRNYQHADILDSVAKYIKTEFISYGFNHVAEQSYIVKNTTYRNVIASVGPSDSALIIIGAHYDVYGETPGADDNASGVAGLLETARIVSQNKDSLKNRFEFVAYTLEEPPFFRTRFMGSYVHATYISDNLTNVKLMIAFDMIGYYSDAKKSQEFPLGILKLFHGTKGNFIGCVSNMKCGKYAKKLTKAFNTQTEIRSISMVALSICPGIDFSDHRNYWGYKMPAILLTDGAFYRNQYYHTKEDTMEKLNFSKIVQVVNGVARFVLQLQ